MQNATPEQITKAFQLCDILGLADVTLAFSILEQLNWNLEKAVQVMQDTAKTNQSKSKSTQSQYELPPNYANADEEPEQQRDQQHYEYVFDSQQNFNNNKRIFDEAYEQIKLDRSTTQPPNKLERRLSLNRHIIEDFSNYRHAYQIQLLEDSQKFCEKMLGKNPKEMKKVDESKIKNEINKNFISYLSKNYRCSINFTFGTFMLNLARSYLDKKVLLVYIHQMQHEDSRSLRMILSHKQTTQFINKNCISYGMFDNCDDYEIIQKYVPMKQLPAFALFKFSNKNRKQRFLSSYQILQKQPQNFLQWLATNIGVAITKKSQVKKTQQQVPQKKENKQKITEQIYSHRDIMSKQNEEYEQMQRIYKLRRQQSLIKKQEIEKAEKQVLKMKQKFKDQIKFQDGKTIQIKFRLPETGKSIGRVFLLDHKVKDMFDFVSCFGREEFEQKYANFDLTQTFPRLSLIDKQQKEIKQIFQGSSHENIIVKQL